MPCAIQASPLERLRVFQTLNRDWRPHLSSPERDFTGYLLDNSLCWGRDAVRTTVAEMVRGSQRLRPVGLSERSVFRLLERLRRVGLVFTRVVQGAVEYGVNLLWKPESQEEGQDMSTIRQPKRLRAGAANQAADPANLAEAPCQFGSAIYKGDVLKGDEETRAAGGREAGQQVAGEAEQADLPLVTIRTRSRPATPARSGTPGVTPASGPVSQPLAAVQPRPATPAPFQPLRAPGAALARPETPAQPALFGTAAEALARVAAKRAEKVGQPGGATPWAVWRDTWRETFPGAAQPLPWSKREQGQWSTIRQRLAAASVAWPDFLHWTVANWRALMPREFSWMKTRPDFPQIGFLLRWLPRIMDRYAEGRARAEVDMMPGEKGEYQRLRMAGRSHDEAMVALGERRAASKRGAAQQGAIGLNRAQRELDRKREELARKEADLLVAARRLEALAAQAPAAQAAGAATPAPAVRPAPVQHLAQHGDNPWERGVEADIPLFDDLTWED